MKYAMELKEAREDGIEVGDTKRCLLVIRNLMEMHMPVEVIAKAVDQTPQYVQQVIAEAQSGRV